MDHLWGHLQQVKDFRDKEWNFYLHMQGKALKIVKAGFTSRTYTYL